MSILEISFRLIPKINRLYFNAIVLLYSNVMIEYQNFRLRAIH